MQNRSDFVADSFASEKRILFSKLALKTFHRLNSHRLRKNIDMRIRQLAIHPYPKHCKKLKAAQNLWEISQGSYRIWYEPRCAAGEIEIVWIGHHQDDYRKPKFMKRIA